MKKPKVRIVVTFGDQSVYGDLVISPKQFMRLSQETLLSKWLYPAVDLISNDLRWQCRQVSCKVCGANNVPLRAATKESGTIFVGDLFCGSHQPKGISSLPSVPINAAVADWLRQARASTYPQEIRCNCGKRVIAKSLADAEKFVTTHQHLAASLPPAD